MKPPKISIKKKLENGLIWHVVFVNGKAEHFKLNLEDAKIEKDKILNKIKEFNSIKSEEC